MPANPMLFINVLVASLDASIAFYKAIGFQQNPKYSAQTSAMMSIGPTHPGLDVPSTPHSPSRINVMLLTHEFFRTFLSLDREMINAKEATGILLCLSTDIRDEVDDIVQKALRAGGQGDVGRIQEMEGMYGRSFADLDGNVWEIMWMSRDAISAEKPPQPKK